MRLYQPEKHEILVANWFFELRKDRDEFENLFAEPLRSLTAILWWAKHEVNVMFDADDVGIRFAAWCAPYLSGAEFGAWSRKDVRGSKGHLKFMDEAYDRALSMYPVLIGMTKQPRLHNIHLKMGYEFKCEIPSLFDGSTARVYVMTAESRANRMKVRQEMRNGREFKQDVNGNGKQPLRASHREIRQSVPAGGEDLRTAGNGSAENGGSQRADSNNKSRRGRKPRSRVGSEHADAGSAGAGGIG